MATITNCLDLYDLFVITELQKRFTAVADCKWLYAPSDLAIRIGKEKFDEHLFPMYSVFRSEPAVKTEEGSLANYRNRYTLADDTSMFFLNVTLEYQIDFWSKKMHEINKSNIDYYKFQTNRILEFDFSDVGLDEYSEPFQAEILFEEPAANHSIDDMFNTGRYFRYTYTITMNAILFDVNTEVPFTQIVLGLYEEDIDHKIFEMVENF